MNAIRPFVLIGSLLLLFFPLAGPQAADPLNRPDIIIVYIDDMRFNGLSSTGHPFVQTPNIDRIASEGITFRNAFVVTPLCSPSRASMYTGQYARTHGVKGNNGNNSVSDSTLITFVKKLQEAGYFTAHIGKWHMNPSGEPRDGFDHWVSFFSQGTHTDPTLYINGKQVKKEGYTTDVLTDEAIEFVQQPRDGEPFAMVLSYKAVHEPFPADSGNVPPHLRTLYEDEVIQLPPSAQTGYTLDGKHMLLNPPIEAERGPPIPGKTGTSLASIRNQLRMTAHIDENMARLRHALEQRGKLDATLLVFTSDNGFFWREHGLYDKRLPYEESIRVPLLMRFPPLIAAGTIADALVTNIDLAPTVLEVAGAEPNESIQGKSLLPVLQNPAASVRDAFITEYFREELFPQIATWKAVRNRRYKYITYPGHRLHWDELYDLQSDPYEMTNIVDAAEAQQTLEDMRALMAQLEGEIAIVPFSAATARADANWTSINVPNGHSDMVIITGPPTYRGTNPGVVRIQNITDIGFELRFQEWDYRSRDHGDNFHQPEDIPYLVLQAGRHRIDGNSVWEVGTFDLQGTASWTNVSFTKGFAKPPHLFLTVQTSNGPQAVAVRARNVTTSGFEAALFEEEALMDGHVVEEVGYLAIYSAEGSGEIEVSGNPIPYLLQSPSVDDRFAPVLSSALKLEEEQSKDAELSHVKETLSVLALDDLIFAQDVNSVGGDTAALRRLAPKYRAPLEWGTVDGVTHDWTTVPLAKSFTNPVVVAKPVSANGTQPGVIRVRKVGNDSFDLRYQEWLYLDRMHVLEQVFYLVAEAGQFTVAGLDVEAGKLNSSLLLSDGFETVSFSTAFLDTPAVFTGVMTANGSDPVITRVNGLTSSGFFVTMDEEEARRAGGHLTETLGWIAVERGSGTTADSRDVTVSQTTADHQAVTTSLGLSTDRQFPVMVGDVVSIFGGNPVFLRYRNLTPSSADLFLQEEQSLDAETTHVLEDISLFVAE